MAKTVDLYSDTHFRLSFGGNDFKETLTFVKSLEGRTFNYVDKSWLVPISPPLIKVLKENQWRFLNDAHDLAYRNPKPISLEVKEIEKADINRKVLNKTLRPYQIEALAQICGLKGRAILSFPPGCGKTAVAASYFRIHLEHAPVLVVCPAFLKIHWKRELLFWGGLGSYICSGRKPSKAPHKVPAWVINYDLLQYWKDHLIMQHFQTIIIDECQMVSNDQTARTDSLIQICKGVPHIMGVSGTPIKNRPREFYTMLHMLDPKTFDNRYKFMNRYCGPRMVFNHLTFDGATHIEELHALVSQYMIRKEKKELLPELPKKVRYTIPMELSQPDAYRQAEEEIDLLLKQNKKKQAYDALIELSNTAFPLKIDSVFAWIDNWLENNPEESLIIAAYHHAVIDYLKEKYKDAIVIDGRGEAGKRQLQVDAFQRGESRILIGQILAAGIGFTLTKASTMAIVEVCYVPGDLEQMEDRCHRIGTIADEVSIYYLVGEGTIEDAMLDTVAKKANNLSRILDGKKMEFFKE